MRHGGWRVAGFGLLAAAAAAAAPRPPAIPAPIWGVTLDRVNPLPELEAALTGFSRTLTARIVFDGPVTATEYLPAVTALRRRTWIMGELWDSYDFKVCGVEQYRRRVASYYGTLHGVVDLWEAGNEVNGEWTGDPRDVVTKTLEAARYLRGRGAATALTLVFNPGCWDKPGAETFRWIGDHLTPADRDLFDYVLLSYYQDECNHFWPDWDEVFRRLGEAFPNAWLGFGEVGTEKGDKPGLLKRYYGLTVRHPRYVGGYFWWYFADDMVPKSKPLWADLQEAVR